MIIKILGPGCDNCARLESRTREAVESLGCDATIEKVTDFGEIAGYGVMRTPGWWWTTSYSSRDVCRP